MKSESKRIKYKAFIRPAYIKDGKYVLPPLWRPAKRVEQ
jgi:hypothetical protein